VNDAEAWERITAAYERWKNGNAACVEFFFSDVDEVRDEWDLTEHEYKL